MRQKTYFKKTSSLISMFAMTALISAAIAFPQGSACAHISAELASIKPYKSPDAEFHGSRLRAGSFLIASPGLKDPRFSQTVILLVSYGPSGATGLVINRPLKIKVYEALPELKDARNLNNPVYFGGPVEMNTAFNMLASELKAPAWGRKIVEGVYLGVTEDAFKAIGNKADGPKSFRVYAGYAGWAPGQLETEIRQGGWSVAPADKTAIFADSDDDIWKRLSNN